MERGRVSEKWLLSPATSENEVEGDEEEEAALSLCDLPINEDEQSRKEASEARSNDKSKIQDEFDFCSLLKESEMCSADQVFFQGQILPLRHSVSSESGLFAASRSNSRRCLSRSESMEHGYNYSSSGLFTSGGGSSRSSSIRSQQSSSSSGSGGSAITTPIYRPRRVKRNQFHSHPSPKPQINCPNIKNQSAGNCPQKSTMWGLFRLGLVTPPEIVLEDLKVRSINKNFQSRNSTSSSSSSITGVIRPDSKKNKEGIFDGNGGLFSGCRCSTKAVETVPSRVVGTRMKRSVSSSRKDASYSHGDEMIEMKEGTEQKQEGKQALSRHRTFEWLKQLSLESTTQRQVQSQMMTHG